jgi:hypothetical protein
MNRSDDVAESSSQRARTPTSTPGKPLDVVWEQVADEDAVERVLQAYTILLCPHAAAPPGDALDKMAAAVHQSRYP